MRKSLAVLSLSTCLFSSFAAESVELLKSPWLHRVVPDKITAYARIPHPLFYFGETQSPLKPLYESTDYKQAVNQINKNVLRQLGDSSLKPNEKELIRFLLSQLKAPVELALSHVQADLSSPPVLLIASKLELADQATFESAFLAQFKQLPVTINTQQQGQGTFTIHPKNIPGSYRYDEKSGKLLLVIGHTDEAFIELIDASQQNSSPLAHIEKQIDQSGQGLFVWIKPPEGLLAAVPQMLPPSAEEAKRLFALLQLNTLRQIALGFGSVDKRPKIKLIIDMPDVGLRKLFPVHSLAPTIAYSGYPDYITTLSLPDEKQLDDIVTLLDSEGDLTPRYQAVKTQFQQQSGIDFSTLLATLGGKIVFFADDNGQYAAIPSAAETAITKILSALQSNKIPVQYDTQVINGQTIHHVSLQKLLEEASKKQTKANTAPASLTAALGGSLYLQGNHIYWVKEGDYLIFNSLPQPLMARKGTMSGTLAEWQAAQGQNSTDATLSATVNYRRLSQQAYYANLRFLHMLADAAKTSVDIAKFPTANALSLPGQGTVGLSVNNGGDALRIELSTENGINDIYTVVSEAYGPASIATVGILSALAIPAYHDYTWRAKTAKTLDLLRPIKETITQQIEAGTAVTAITTEAIRKKNNEIDNIANVNGHIGEISVKDGEITVTFSGKSGGKTLILTLTPQTKAGKVIGWTCNKGTLPDRQRPSECRK